MTVIISALILLAVAVADFFIIAFFRGVYSRDKPDDEDFFFPPPRRTKKTGEAQWRESWEKRNDVN